MTDGDLSLVEASPVRIACSGQRHAAMSRPKTGSVIDLPTRIRPWPPTIRNATLLVREPENIFDNQCHLWQLMSEKVRWQPTPNAEIVRNLL